jgi:hypothetical protein
MPKPTKLRYGPSKPIAGIRTITRRGLRALNVSQPMPSLSATPIDAFSITTSAFSTRRRNVS